MKFKLLILTFVIFFSSQPESLFALSFNNSVISETLEFEQGQNPVRKSGRKLNKVKKNRADEKIPLYGTLSLSAAVLTLLMLGLGIAFNFEISLAIIAAILAIIALVFAIIGIKKGESKSLNFIGIMIGAVGLIGAIFFAISVSS